MTNPLRSIPTPSRPDTNTEGQGVAAASNALEVSAAVEEPLDRPTVSVDIAAQLLGISRASAFRAVHRGQLPAIRLGRRIVIPTAELRNMLHLPTQA